MSSIAIECEGISKRYRLGELQRYRALRDTLTDVFRISYRRLGSILKPGATPPPAESNWVWALENINLEVREGEVLGIIGRNAAGKSTLLKILSRITKPTAGHATIRGRIGSLLEIGTGFHPELTGRENIYLNGAILGMSRREIDRRFDEIVDFSECERFLDTQVKHYSSGMHMRLAFAVAAHLETEILLIDEVLAVGDAPFQEKCLGKMGAAAHQGRTVLFVSHNLLAVDSLCSRAICLHEGKIVMEGSARKVTSRYLREWLLSARSTEVVYDDPAKAPGDHRVRLHRASVRPASSTPAGQITVRTPVVLEFEYWQESEQSNIQLGLDLYNEQGILIFSSWSPPNTGRRAGWKKSSVTIPGDLLNAGVHRIDLFITMAAIEVFALSHLLVFEVQDVADLRQMYHDDWPGAVRPNLPWVTEDVSTSRPTPISPINTP